MTRYANRGGDSGVAEFEIRADSIEVTFSDGSGYLYTYARPGVAHTEAMKELAKAGQGLNSYINKYVRKLYEKKTK